MAQKSSAARSEPDTNFDQPHWPEHPSSPLDLMTQPSLPLSPPPLPFSPSSPIDLGTGTAEIETSSTEIPPSPASPPSPYLIPLPPSRPSTPDLPTHSLPSAPENVPKTTPPSHSTPRYLAHRRPKGWISSLHSPARVQRFASASEVEVSSREERPVFTPPRATSAAGTGWNDGAKAEANATPPRARVTSVHAQRAQGQSQRRRVSSAMQHAILRVVDVEHSGLADSRDRELADFNFEDDGNTMLQVDDQAVIPPLDGGGERKREVGGPPAREEEEGADGEAISFASPTPTVEGLTNQDEDEVWMSYVRQQLGALFPEFFNSDPTSLASTSHQQETTDLIDAEGRYGDTSVRSDTNEAMETSFGSTDTLESDVLPTPPHTATTVVPRRSVGVVDGMSMGMGMGVAHIPNVREEIGSLRDEIMRLRSVVGGLAAGLSGGAGIGSVPQEGEGQDAEEVDRIVHANCDDEGDSRAVEGGAKQEMQDGNGNEDRSEDLGASEPFLKTADMSASIIRALDIAVRYHGATIKSNSTLTISFTEREDKGNNEETKNAPAGSARSDEDVFSAENLGRIMDYVKGMS